MKLLPYIFICAFLVSCGTQNTTTTDAIDKVKIVPAKPVDTTPVRESLNRIGVSVNNASDNAAEAEDHIRDLQRDLDAAIGTTQKLERLTALLRATSSADKEAIMRFAERLELATAENEAQRVENLATVQKLTDSNARLKANLTLAKKETEAGKINEVELKADIKDLNRELKETQGKMNAYRGASIQNEKAAEAAKKEAAKNQWWADNAWKLMLWCIVGTSVFWLGVFIWQMLSPSGLVKRAAGKAIYNEF